jgi:hypothetical protein
MQNYLKINHRKKAMRLFLVKLILLYSRQNFSESERADCLLMQFGLWGSTKVRKIDAKPLPKVGRTTLSVER